MNIQVRYDADPDSELLTKEERHRQRMMWYETVVRLSRGSSPTRPLPPIIEYLLNKVRPKVNPPATPPPPEMDDPDYDFERGIFTLELTELQALMELAELDDARLQVGHWVKPMRPRWEKEWSFTPTEYYARVQSELSAIRSSAEFDWKLFEPVYSPDNPEGNALARLVAWLLEQGHGVCWCKACQQEYPALELEIYDWEGNEIDGSMYLCPHDHALLRTDFQYLGAFMLLYEDRRTKRERRPNPVAQAND